VRSAEMCELVASMRYPTRGVKQTDAASSLRVETREKKAGALGRGEEGRGSVCDTGRSGSSKANLNAGIWDSRSAPITFWLP